MTHDIWRFLATRFLNATTFYFVRFEKKIHGANNWGGDKGKGVKIAK